MGQGTVAGHNIDNYMIGAGILWLKLKGETDYTDCGNVSVFEFLPKPTILKHYSKRTPSKTLDQTAVTVKEATLTMNFEDFNARNVTLATLGALIDSGSPGGAVS